MPFKQVTEQDLKGKGVIGQPAVPGLSVTEMQKSVEQVVREAAKEISGGGGGQPFYATAGGKDVAGIEKAIFRAVELIKTQLKR